MQKIILTFLFLLSIFLLHAQTKIDSLWNDWNDETQADTSRLKTMNYMINQVIRNQPDSAQTLAQIMLDFATKKNLLKYRADAFLHLSRSLAFRSKSSEENFNFANKSFEIYKELDDHVGAAHALSNMGGYYISQRNLKLGLEYFEKALYYAEESGSYYYTSNIIHIIGEAYLEFDADHKALEYFKRGLKHAELGGLKREKSQALREIGHIYQIQGEYTLAQEYNQHALKLARETGVKREISEVYRNMGLVNIDLGEYDSALDNLEHSLLLQQEIENQEGIANDLIRIGLVYRESKDYVQAFKYIDRASNISLENNFLLNLATIYNSKGDIYYSLGDHNEAIKWCKKGQELSKEINSLKEGKVACQCLYEAYKAIKNTNKALIYLEKFLEINILLNEGETSIKLQQMEFAKQILQDSIANAEEDRLVQEAHLEEVRLGKQNRNYLIGAGLLLLFLVLVFYSLWRYVHKSKAIIEKEKDHSDNLLLNILPAKIAEELKLKGSADTQDFEQVSILFTDFKEFTQIAEKMSSKDLVAEINHCFKAFDFICEKYGIEKIKTIGDSYMAAGGLPVPNIDSTPNMVLAALEMADFITNRKVERKSLNKEGFEMRAGIHTGNVVAGIVGVKKFQYDIWGDTVNTASRMESNGKVGKVNISKSTYEVLKDDPKFSFQFRGKVGVKGKGEIEMWFVENAQ